jgi:hypothetical protein
LLPSFGVGVNNVDCDDKIVLMLDIDVHSNNSDEDQNG